MEPTISHGYACGHQAEKPTQILSDEHRVIERVLGAVEKLAKGPVGALEPWKKAHRVHSRLRRSVPPLQGGKSVVSRHGGARHPQRGRSHRHDADWNTRKDGPTCARCSRRSPSSKPRTRPPKKVSWAALKPTAVSCASIFKRKTRFFFAWRTR